ncbi:MAG: winged helix-turn-helix domain-containing protein, partial [Chloroflexota bacterium]
MEFAILGTLRVRSGDVVLDLGAPAQRALLAVLLTSPGTAVPDDRLVDELWSEDPPPSANHLLQVYVSRLRALLDQHSDGRRIVREGTGYAICLEPGELDAERFATAVSAARPLVVGDPVAADRLLAQAMRLWRGS